MGSEMCIRDSTHDFLKCIAFGRNTQSSNHVGSDVIVGITQILGEKFEDTKELGCAEVVGFDTVAETKQRVFPLGGDTFRTGTRYGHFPN